MGAGDGDCVCAGAAGANSGKSGFDSDGEGPNGIRPAGPELTPGDTVPAGVRLVTDAPGNMESTGGSGFFLNWSQEFPTSPVTFSAGDEEAAGA